MVRGAAMGEKDAAKKKAWHKRFLHSLRREIFAVILVPLLCYILVMTVAFWQILRQSSVYQLSQASRQSADLLISSIESDLETINSLSYSLIQNDDITRWLRGGDEAAIREAYRLLMQTYTTFSGIEAIYLYRQDGEELYAQQHMPVKSFGDYQETSWYKRAEELRGASFVSLNADGSFYSKSGQNNISFIRQVLDLGSFGTLGCMVIHLNENFVTNITRQIYERYDTEFYLLDEAGSSVIRSQTLPEAFAGVETEGLAGTPEGSYFVYRTTLPGLGWTVVSAMPYNTGLAIPFLPVLFVFSVAFAVMMNLLVLAFITRLITRPLQGMMASMRGVQEGRFEPLPPDERRDEIGQLTDNYNRMVNELNRVILQKVEMEREKRRYELDILGEQIKPHFLYNTLDTISYLILADHTREAASAVQALGRYYSISLSKGAETVPLQDEIQLVQNYLSLQKLRYGELIEDHYSIADEVKELHVLRNILQPIVENCIYHGIKPSGEPGGIFGTTAWA